MNRNWTRWARAAGVRALKTVAQTLAASLGACALLTEINWLEAASAALLAGLLSLLTSVAGLPELDEGREA